MARSVVTRYRFDDPASFLRTLGGLTHPLFRDHAKQVTPGGATWLFRGQWNANLPLLPKAWRDVTPEREYWAARMTAAGVRDSIAQALRQTMANHPEYPYLDALAFNALLEYVMTQEFILEADQLGFSVSEVSEYLPQADDTRLSFALEYAHRFLRLDLAYARSIWCKQSIAFAQHHGIPTRLLDWTVNPFTAAFFAARDAVNAESSARRRGSLVVYAIIEQELDAQVFPVIRVPQAENLYMRLQGGVFTIDLEAERRFAETGDYPDLAASLRSAGKRSVLSLYLLPRAQAAPLLEMLRQMDISAATLMPNAEHVAETLSLAWRTGYPKEHEK